MGGKSLRLVGDTTPRIHSNSFPQLERDQKSFQHPPLLARVCLHREGAFFFYRSGQPGPGSCKLAPVGKASQVVLKAAMSGLQVCDGDNREQLTSHFPFGLLSVYS